MKPAVVVLVFVCLGFVACTSDASESISVVETTVDSSTTISTQADLPSSPTNPWPVGPLFVAEEFELNGETRSHRITLGSFNSTSFGLNLGVCGFGGSADFQLANNKLIVPSGFDREAIGCPDQPQELIISGEALEMLFLSQPQVTTTGNSITVKNESIAVTLVTEDPTADVPVAPTGVWFRAVSTNSNEIDPTSFAVRMPALFVIEVQLETCLLRGGIGAPQPDQPRDVVTAIQEDNCPNPSPSDQAALDLLAATPILAFANQQLTLASPDGTQIVLE